MRRRAGTAVRGGALVAAALAAGLAAGAARAETAAVAKKPDAASGSASAPAAPAARDPFHRNDAEVTRALRDELGRSMKELRVPDASAPYYVAYAVSDVDQVSASATFGAVTGAWEARGRTLRTEVRVGDRAFDNGNFPDGVFAGGRVEALPVDDDYAALRRELWLRTDEAYKAAVETIAKKRAAAAGQAERDEGDDVPDFSDDHPAELVVPLAAGALEAAPLGDIAARLSGLLRDYAEISGCRVTAMQATVRRRFASSAGGMSDEARATVRVDVVAETQAPDGMRLSSFVPFTALTLAGLPPAADMERAVRKMADELVAMRVAPIASSGTASVLFEGAAAAQLAKLLLADQLSGTPAPRTAAGAEERGQSSELSGKLGQKVASPMLTAVDDPLADVASGGATAPGVAAGGKIALYGAYRVDDEGIAARKVVLVDGGILRGLLMTRTPRKEILRSNGHARAPRFGGPRAAIGNLFLSGKAGARHAGLPRAALLGEMARLARGGGVDSYVVKLLEDPSVPGASDGEGQGEDSFMFSMSGGRTAPAVKPLVVYRVGPGGKEELVRGLTLEGLVPRSLKDIVALGKEPTVYNFYDGGGGVAGIPASIVTPALLLSDVDVRRSIGKHKKPPLYPRPLVSRR